MHKLIIVKIGGNIIDDKLKLSSFLKDFARIQEAKILVHGGGRLATKLAEQLNIPQQIIEGRRVTDPETLKIVTMVYAGYINKNIVCLLQANGCNAIGLTGADGNMIRAHKRMSDKIDFGFAGDVDSVNEYFLKNLLGQKLFPVIAPVTHDGKGQLLNTNADTIAQEIAKAMSAFFDIHLIYSFEKSGVLLNAEDDTTVIPSLTPAYYQQLRKEQKIVSGMIPKLDNAFSALKGGVKKITIGKAENLKQMIDGISGTGIINE